MLEGALIASVPNVASTSPRRPAVVTLSGVRKGFGEIEALAGVTAEVPAGVIGLLGPNGAGKTTLLRLLVGLDQADDGGVEVLGWTLPQAALQAATEIGYMPEDDCLFPNLSGVNQVVHAAMLSGLPSQDAHHRAHRCMDLVGVEEARHRPARGYSLGMRQRTRLAMSIVHGPRLVLLDEPTAGLDPAGRDEMLTVIGEIGAAGTSVLLSTHVLSDVEAVCDQVLLLSRGKLGYCGPMSGFKATANGEVWRLDLLGNVDKALAALRRAGIDCWLDGHFVGARLSAEQHMTMWSTVADVEVGVRSLRQVQETIGDAFLRHLRLDDPDRPRHNTSVGGV